MAYRWPGINKAEWYRHFILKYNINFGSLMRSDSGNYTVNATNYLLDNVTQPVGNDIGSFYLDVLCKL